MSEAKDKRQESDLSDCSVAGAAEPLTIRWSTHAVERVRERFGFDQTIIPNRMIQKIGANKELAEEFRVRRGHVIYVCKRVDNGIVIVTVLNASAD